MKTIVLLFCLVALATAQPKLNKLRQYGTFVNGVEIINPSTPPLAYISNLRLDIATSGNPRLWFIADKSPSNIYYAEIGPGTGNASFWTTASSPFDAGTVSPYISFDVYQGHIAGVAYPSSVSTKVFGVLGYSQVMQAVHVPQNETKGDTVDQHELYSMEFYGIHMGRNATPEGIEAVYMAGWAHDIDQRIIGFAIARAHLDLTSGKIKAAEAKDLYVDKSSQCYDLFTSSYKPNVWVSNGYVLIVVPGPCSRIYKMVLPTMDMPMNMANVKVYFPVNTSVNTIASAAFDRTNQVLWYSTKLYDGTDSIITSIKTDTMFQTLVFQDLIGLGNDWAEMEPILTIANELDAKGQVTKRSLIVSAPGWLKAYWFNAANDGMNLFLSRAANLDTTYNRVGSALYYHPYFYYGTFEPNAQLVRIHSDNFCQDMCGLHAWCNAGTCQCDDEFSVDPSQPDPRTGKPRCMPGYFVTIDREVQQETGATAALATLLAFTLLAGGFGWFLWWKARAQAYSSL